MRTALNIHMEPTTGAVHVKAGVGIFGAQAIPTAIMLFVARPVHIPQIWGPAQQHNLDEEAMQVIEAPLCRQGAALRASAPALAAALKPEFVASRKNIFCAACGKPLPSGAAHCSACGRLMA